MKIPKYVQEIMERSEFVRGNGDPGYTIKIRKATPYTRIPPLLPSETERNGGYS